MANAIIGQLKNENVCEYTIDLVARACVNVQPDNLKIGEPFIKVNHNCVIGLTYNDCAVKVTDNGLLLGNVFKDYEQKWDRMDVSPDGSYGIFRWNNEYIEILSDIGATRTIWYYSDDNYFIASTSQRMIITF